MTSLITIRYNSTYMTLMITSLFSLSTVIVNNAGNGSGSSSTIRIRNQYRTSDELYVF
ncbi:MAG: hypothetical protein WAM27_01640 [Nitrososphaeraceae archaeon]